MLIGDHWPSDHSPARQVGSPPDGPIVSSAQSATRIEPVGSKLRVLIARYWPSTTLTVGLMSTVGQVPLVHGNVTRQPLAPSSVQTDAAPAVDGLDATTTTEPVAETPVTMTAIASHARRLRCSANRRSRPCRPVTWSPPEPPPAPPRHRPSGAGDTAR